MHAKTKLHTAEGARPGQIAKLGEIAQGSVTAKSSTSSNQDTIRAHAYRFQNGSVATRLFQSHGYVYSARACFPSLVARRSKKNRGMLS
jgi:hypothetical protein